MAWWAQCFDERIRNKQNEVILKDSKYAQRSPIGTYEIISTFKPDAIKDSIMIGIARFASSCCRWRHETLMK